MKRNHHGLIAWQEAMALVTQIYEMTADFPEHEKFGLCSQMRRAAISVPSNIAEGAGRAGKKEFCRFLTMARGSLSELETQIMIANNLGYLASIKEAEARVDKIFSLLASLLRTNRKETV